MNKYQDIFNNLNNEKELIPKEPYSRVLLIDSLNLFFRNFAIFNMSNNSGAHIGGLGGYLRSLGVLIRDIQPTNVINVFDGIGSTINRTNIVSTYKGNRHINRITNWDSFQNLQEEDDSKVDQLTRLVQYLKCLPVKTTSIDKAEGDDVISYIATKLQQEYDSHVFIVSVDNDFLQLINDNITVWSPRRKVFYTPNVVKEEMGISPHNLILYKTLLGDTADDVSKIKGLGKKGILKKFPELGGEKLLLEDIFNICEKKYKEHLVYSRIILNRDVLEKNYQVMDLSNPMVDEYGKNIVNEYLKEPTIKLNQSQFLKMHKEDGLEKIIKSPSFWLKEHFTQL